MMPSLYCVGLQRKWYLSWAFAYGYNDLAFRENAFRKKLGIPSIFD